MPRAFIALDLPSSFRKQLLSMSKGLKTGRRVKLDQLHLTLRFLGDVDNEDLDRIISHLRGVEGTALQLTIDKLGYFTMAGGRAVLWAGIAENQKLFDLKFSIDRSIQSILPLEIKRYKPHITLARLKNTPVSKLKHYIANHTDFSRLEVPVSSFTLYSSTLSAGGAIHTPLAVYSLNRVHPTRKSHDSS